MLSPAKAGLSRSPGVLLHPMATANRLSQKIVETALILNPPGCFSLVFGILAKIFSNSACHLGVGTDFVSPRK